MKRLVVAVLIVLFTFSSALPGICSQIEQPLNLQENQPLADWETGSGHFNSYSQTFVVVGEPLKHVVADLNNDSRPDIAVIYNASSQIDIFFSDANDRFNYSNRTTIKMSGPVTDIAAGDVNKDLKQDLVISCNVTGNDVFVLSQANGFNKTAPLHTIASTSKPRALLLKDFDGDSWLDIATLFYADASPYQPGFEVRLHSEGYDLNMIPVGLGSAPLIMQRPSLFAAGDFNLDVDGRIDVVIGDRDSGKVLGYVNGAPSGKVWDTATNTITVSGPSALHMTQLVAGGEMNLMVAEEGSSKIKIWHYISGAFEFRTDVEEHASITSLTTLDVNGDSRLDIVSTSTSKHNLTVFTASTSLLYGYSNSLTFPVPYHPVHVIAHDMDSEGSEDLVVSSRSSNDHGTITIYYHNGQDISNADRNRVVKDISPTLITLGDLNGDGDNEIVAYDPNGPTFSFISETSLLGRLGAPSGILAMESGDLDGDGYDDIALMSATNVTVWFGSSSILSGASRQVTVQSTLPGLSSLLLDDLNNDGRPDITVGRSGGVEMFWSSGTGTLYSETQRFNLSLPGAYVTSLATVLVNGTVHNDLRADLVIINSNASRIELYYQQSEGSLFTVGSSSYLNEIPGLYQLCTGDLSSDGLGDLAVLSPGKVHVYLQNPAYSRGFSDSQPIMVIDVPDGPHQLRLGDLDDDGVLDLALVSENSTLMAYGHDGSSFSIITRQTTGAAPVLLMMDDMDGDLKDDIVAYSTLSRTVSFYYQNNFAPVALGSVVGSGFVEGSPVSFDGSASTDSVPDIGSLNYTWNFNDGGTAYGKTCSYVFMNDGTWTATLVVRDQGGLESDPYTLPPVVVEDLGPTAVAYCTETYLGVSIIEGETVVHFIDESASWPDVIEGRSWDFNDGTAPSTDRNATHVFDDDGIYVVTLTVTDEDGSTDTTTVQVTVEKIPPTAEFEVVTVSPTEGVAVMFNDLSYSPGDNITSWYWEFGDGGTSALQNPTHVYDDNGQYVVSLTVTDSDNITVKISHLVQIADTSPEYVTIRTLDGSTRYDEAEEVTFVVNASASWSDITKYSWNFSSGTSFSEDLNTTANFASYSYNTSGLVRITVRVWDGDSYTESSIEITIVNLPPDANFTYQINGKKVTFNAITSSDTENDLSSLQFRWYIEGVWSIWSGNPVKTHDFSQVGTYSVKLEVKDDNDKMDNITKSVTLVELNGPTIELIDWIERVNVNDSITVRAIVTDVSGIDSVVLQYVIDNVTYNVTMTLEDVDTYFGQIPAQNHTMKIIYRIIAEDAFGNVAFTDDIRLSVVDPPGENDDSLFLTITALLLIVLLMLMMYLFLSRPIVDEVFVMYHDGTLLAHQTRRLKPGMDDEILGGMLIALQNFVRDSFKDESSTVLRRMDFGERKLLVERKDEFFMAVVLSGKRAGKSAQRMLKVLNSIEKNYAPVLKDWDGDLDKVRGIRDETKPIFQRANPLDRLKLKEGEDDSV